MNTEPATVVMLGDVGMGKSTIVEKVAGVTGLSSCADESFTNYSVVGVSPCNRLQMIDTPGGNPIKEKLEHNMWIAHALNYAPVSSILLTVKADLRIDNTVDWVRNYAERFQDAWELLTIVVTHMDTVQWNDTRFRTCLETELGLDSVIFVGKDTPGASIVTSILEHCKSPQLFSINSANFLKLFKIHNNNMKILKSVRNEIESFQLMKQVFEAYHASLSSEQHRADLVFEFQAYMTDQIVEAQKRVSAHNNFTFMGDHASIANQSGHIASLTNQLRAVLFDVRTMALAHQKDAGVTDLRKCPHCGEVWQKITGCDGITTCGEPVNQPDSRRGRMSTYAFRFDGSQLHISREADLRAQSLHSGRRQQGYGAGCGREINWSEMAPVRTPEEFRTRATASTDDIDLLPAQQKRKFDQVFKSKVESLGPIQKMPGQRLRKVKAKPKGFLVRCAKRA